MYYVIQENAGRYWSCWRGDPVERLVAADSGYTFSSDDSKPSSYFKSAAEPFDWLVSEGLVTGYDDPELAINPVSGGLASAAINPRGKLDADTLPPAMSGLTFSAISREEFNRIVSGYYSGMTITGTVGPTVNYTRTESHPAECGPCGCCTADILTVHETGDQKQVTRFSFSRTCSARNCAKPAAKPDDESGIAFQGAELTLAPTSIETDTPTRQAALTHTASQALTYNVELCSETNPCAPGDPSETDTSLTVTLHDLTVRFVLNADGTIGLVFFAALQGMALQANPGLHDHGIQLYLYAPITGCNNQAAYGMTPVPDGSADIYYPYPCTFTEIDMDGPTLFGVQLKVWGWKAEVAHDADATSTNEITGCLEGVQESGTEKWEPTFNAVEIVA